MAVELGATMDSASFPLITSMDLLGDNGQNIISTAQERLSSPLIWLPEVLFKTTSREDLIG